MQKKILILQRWGINHNSNDKYIRVTSVFWYFKHSRCIILGFTQYQLITCSSSWCSNKLPLKDSQTRSILFMLIMTSTKLEIKSFVQNLSSDSNKVISIIQKKDIETKVFSTSLNLNSKVWLIWTIHVSFQSSIP